MAWIKRNLFFLIGSLIAVALMAVGIVYLLGQLSNEEQITSQIQQQYAELTRLAQQKPHPGNDKVDNIKAAKEQQAMLRDFIKKERGYFQHIASIPETANAKVGNADFARELRNTVSQLHHSAEQQSVKLPPDYYFTFEAQKKSLLFDPGSLDKLAMHLGEINALCEILFAAKINYLDSFQREVVSTNQDNNPSDYLPSQKTVFTPLAEVTPYQITFRCFSAELARVLARLASSPDGFMVQSINVEPVNAPDPTMGGNSSATPPPPPPPHRVTPPGTQAPAGASASRTTAFLNEKLFRVTLLVQVVKPKPAK